MQAAGTPSRSLLPVLLRFRRDLVHNRLLGERSVRVLRDVFALSPTDIHLAVPDVADGWLDAQ